MFLKAENVTITFGGVNANKNVNVTFEKGQIVGLIGPNGAGKSTFFKAVIGFNRVASGHIYFKGEEITNQDPYKICRKGISTTFQKAQAFPDMTLEESVRVGAYCRIKNKKEAIAKAQEMIDFVGLTGKEKAKISKLNMYDRKKAELAAALATQPELLLLDELFAGLVPSEVELILKYVKKVSEELGITLLIVEHVLRVVMSLCDKVFVLENGQIIANGSPEEVANNPKVIKAYLGGDSNVAAG